MLVNGYPPEDVFARVPELAPRVDPVLRQLDRLLDDDRLFDQVRSDLVQRYRLTAVHGRYSTPAEVVLRLLVVKHLYAWSYQETVERVAESLVLRWFCRVYFRRVPVATTLLRWAQTIQPPTLHLLNDRAAQLAAQVRVTRARKLRVDGTVVETTIHHPTDSGLLGDGVRVLTRLIKRAQPLVGATLAGTRDVFRDRTRTMRRALSALHRLVRRKGEAVEAEQRQLYQHLLQTTEQVVQQAQQVSQAIGARLRCRRPSAPERVRSERLRQAMAHFLPLVEQVIRQTRTRVLERGQVPAQEKIVSLFAPHTRILQRRKTGVPIEFGRHVVQDASGRRHRDALPDPARRWRRATGTRGGRGAPSDGLWARAGARGR
jgi:transposase, IS5 family